ncbi:nitrate reductase molybdenum cofactor assembly chaperone [Vogesella sp. LIG4]|uniref:nitrate reductase molybdenum cofactor assembly chaperone n=1 Tax=Vogesella sp. LIG4 TaxID=1192162 RepID=UPI00081FA9CD|nr:nitrate reductase molybdenum cofactor assembly chaperone [Vogesella sp. LIG4]SCK29046.1 respiratory nitrate reductase chaperone NarJ [Vogesella sp. LIG4]
MHNPMIYRALAALLGYPQAELVEALPEIRAVLAGEEEVARNAEPLLQRLAAGELIELQQDYVQIFDRNPSHSLHLFEHIHGEDRARGQAMVDLIEEYKAHGFEPVSEELPDYVPLFLEFLSLCEADEANRLLGDAVHVLAHVGNKLADSGSDYAGVLAALVWLSPVAPEPLSVPPIRDMDEALETFGPGIDGVEPLLKPALPQIAPVNFYPKGSGPAACH